MNMKQSCKALICAIEGELDGRHCTEEQAAAILDHALPSLTEALARVQSELAEAVGLIEQVLDYNTIGDAKLHRRQLEAFLARHAQAEQQEAREQVLARPEHGVSLDEALALTVDRYSGAMEKLAVIEHQEAQGAQAGEFQREDRYIVIKRKDLEEIENSAELSDLEAHKAVLLLSEALDTLHSHLPVREYLVIESDWPEYEQTWAAIRARVEGRATQPAAGTTSDKYRAELYDEVWQKARDMGYANVTGALVELERMKATQPAAGEPVAWRYVERTSEGYPYAPQFSAKRWQVTPEEYSEEPLYLAPPAAAPVAAGEPVEPKEIGEMTITLRDGVKCFSFEEYSEAYKLPEGLHYLYAAAPAAAHGDEAVRKNATESAIQRACRELPEGWSLQIELERGAGDVTLFNAWDIVVDFGQDFESSISEQFEAAIDAAMRAQGDGGEV
ncbi:hypothetical protein V6W80_17330 [Pseudomonas benzopyrenica]|uniref:Uncharacterized protein n=1 Tax=Pseudomonas benzopyrenica TaxID=2993566 RepID=A0ABZ2FKW0_9PSED